MKFPWPALVGWTIGTVFVAGALYFTGLLNYHPLEVWGGGVAGMTVLWYCRRRP